MDVKKVAHILSVPFAKVGAPQSNNDSSNPPENFHNNVCLANIFDLNILYSYSKLFKWPFLMLSMHKIRQKTRLGLFDPLRHSSVFDESAKMKVTYRFFLLPLGVLWNWQNLILVLFRAYLVTLNSLNRHYSPIDAQIELLFIIQCIIQT